MKKKILSLCILLTILSGCGSQTMKTTTTAEDSSTVEIVQEQSSSSEETLIEEPIPLKDLCGEYFTLGVGINGSTLENQTLNIPEYMDLCKQEFNSCTLTNLMKSCLS